jgi:hypothetical protein
MKIFHSYGSKERLFELMKRVGKLSLNEEVLPREKRNEIINDFVKFVDGKIDFNGDIPNMRISYDDNDAREMKSYGRYIPETNEIFVVAANRALADILRTIAHELIHQKQKEEGRLKPNSGETGSDEENEANALAGVLMREFGKINPTIFE